MLMASLLNVQGIVGTGVKESDQDENAAAAPGQNLIRR